MFFFPLIFPRASHPAPHYSEVLHAGREGVQVPERQHTIDGAAAEGGGDAERLRGGEGGRDALHVRGGGEDRRA